MAKMVDLLHKFSNNASCQYTIALNAMVCYTERNSKIGIWSCAKISGVLARSKCQFLNHVRYSQLALIPWVNMKCPYCCHEEMKVTDSRDASEMNAIRRRRECLGCFKRFTTFETVELTVEVKKRDGRYEDFAQDKLIKGLEAACNHTTVSREQVFAVASQITGDIMQRQVREITTTELGDLVMKHLQALDPIAYIRFACVYRRFKKVDELVDAIQAIKPKDDTRHREE